MPEVADSFEWLARKVKENSAKFRQHAFFTSREFGEKFSAMKPEEFAEWVRGKLDGIAAGTVVQTRIGRTLDDLRTEMRDEYLKRKQGKSFKLWKTPFNALNDAIGGLYSGDIYGVMAESGRGKSYLIIALIDELLRQGAKVLVKSYELKAYLWVSRLISIMTARDEVAVDELGRKVGLPNRAILSGKLDEDTERYFLEMLGVINEYYPGELILQAKGDRELTRTLKDLERELAQRPDIDAVVVDPFYGLTDVYGNNANKTAGGAAEQAASTFERIVGEHDVVGIYAVQATVEKKSRDEGQRELKLPTRDQVKTTKRLLDIATVLFAFDSVEQDGQALLGIEKGRNGAEDTVIELIALLDHGVLKELPSGIATSEQFAV
ncbi:AAA family ATPase [Brevibacillus brevis]|uniref:AAA family ATPase n=1 Tax=Brevibacillus brevis TaxID=1393 RepID=UPI001EE2B567|nr:AAA family ATPase [Brevibacillus brevis]